VTEFDPADLTGTPYLAPLVPPLPIRLRRTEILTVVYRTETAAARRVVPQPLRATGDLVVAHVYWMHDAEWFGVYGESAWQIPVELPGGRPAVYSPFLILGSDGAVAAGREAYGQPKKEGNISLGARGDLLVGTVERNGIDIATATMVYKQQAAAAEALEQLVPGSGTNVNLRVLPHEAGTYRRELIARDFTDVTTRESWSGPATLELRPNAQAPVHLLPVGEVVLGLHRVLDLTLAPGEVVYRYPDVSQGPPSEE
jgi:acetoacetate decarboxylase